MRVFDVGCFILIFSVNSFIFDCLHYLCHKLSLNFHKVHHEFFNSSLTIDTALSMKNIVYHVSFEFISKVLSTLSFSFLMPMNIILSVLCLEVFIVIAVIFCKGEDLNHRTIKYVQRSAWRPYVTPYYHAMHHIYPNAFFSSYHALFDSLFGLKCPIRNRVFLVTGSDGMLGKAFVVELQKKGAKVITAIPNEKSWLESSFNDFHSPLEKADVLVLAHGSKYKNTQENNYISQKKLIKKFIQMKKEAICLPEIWGVGSEIEFCPHLNITSLKDYILSKRAFVRLAKGLYKNKTILYRHIVPSAFTSKMGRGLISAKITVKIALFLIKRGARYVPVSYTGLAFINFVHFL